MYLAGSAILVWIAVVIVSKEQAIKEKVGKSMSTSLVDSDFRLDGERLKALVLFSFLGGFVSGAFGLGGGSIFNPVLIEMGVPPSVSAATGMYMVMLSNMATSVMYATYGSLDFSYSIWLSFWNVLGTIYGFGKITEYIKRTNR